MLLQAAGVRGGRGRNLVVLAIAESADARWHRGDPPVFSARFPAGAASTSHAEGRRFEPRRALLKSLASRRSKRVRAPRAPLAAGADRLLGAAPTLRTVATSGVCERSAT